MVDFVNGSQLVVLLYHCTFTSTERVMQIFMMFYWLAFDAEMQKRKCFVSVGDLQEKFAPGRPFMRHVIAGYFFVFCKVCLLICDKALGFLCLFYCFHCLPV